MDTYNTANIKFNRVVAKSNFKFQDIDTLKGEVIKTLTEDNLTVVGDRKAASSILNPNGTLELQHEVAGEAIAFLADENESAVSIRLIQFNVHGSLRFVYVVRTFLS